MVIAKSELNSSHVVSGGIIELLSDNQDNFRVALIYTIFQIIRKFQKQQTCEVVKWYSLNWLKNLDRICHL